MANIESVQILAAAVNNLTDALDQLTHIQAIHCLDAGAVSPLAMEIQHQQQLTRRLLEELRRCHQNTIRAWTLK
jgi:hypothetical protein